VKTNNLNAKIRPKAEPLAIIFFLNYRAAIAIAIPIAVATSLMLCPFKTAFAAKIIKVFYIFGFPL